MSESKQNVALLGTPSGIWNSTGVAENLNDNNTSTYIQSYCSGDGCSVSLTGIVTFSEPVSIIEDLKFYLYLSWGGTSSRWGGYANIYVEYDGEWHELPHTWDTVPSDIRDWGYTPPGDITLEATGPWFNVTAIKVYLYGAIGGHTSNVTLRAYELEAWGCAYKDIGIRYYDGTSIRKIGVADLVSSHKLRVHNGSEIFGIDLIPVDREDVSNIRIYDGSSIKCLPEID